MTLRDEILEWASGTTNVDEPTPAQVAAGHVLGSVADSGRTNYHTGHQDREIVHALRTAQASSDMSLVTSDDIYNLCTLRHSHYGFNQIFPDSGYPTLALTDSFIFDAVTAWNFERNEACIIHTGDGNRVVRVNTWDPENMVEDDLDVDIANYGRAYGLACDGTYLYVLFNDTVTTTYHIAQMSLNPWTGLANWDRDTLISSTPGGVYASICNADNNNIGFFYGQTTTATFGVLNKTNSSFTTGAGNSASLPDGNLAMSANQPRVVSDGLRLHMPARNDNTRTYLMSANISNPATAPGDITSSYTASDYYHDIVVTATAVVMVDDTGHMYPYYPAASWTRSQINVAGYCEGGDRINALVIGPDIWLVSNLSDGLTRNGAANAVALRYEGSRAVQENVFNTDVPPRSIVPYTSTLTTADSTRAVWDGRSLVILNTASGYLHLITDPGRR